MASVRVQLFRNAHQKAKTAAAIYTKLMDRTPVGLIGAKKSHPDRSMECKGALPDQNSCCVCAYQADEVKAPAK